MNEKPDLADDAGCGCILFFVIIAILFTIVFPHLKAERDAQREHELKMEELRLKNESRKVP